MLHRRGFTLLEAFVAAAVLGGLMVVCLKFFTAAAAQQEAMRDRSRALQLAANVMERLAAEPWDRLTAERVRALQEAEDLRQGLPDAKVEIQMTQPPEEPGAKQIAVLVRWPSRPDVPQRPVRLVAWRYRPIAR
jgi:type II secretory pathway component PulJ